MAYIVHVEYKFYPVSSGGSIKMKDANSFDSIEEILEYLDTASNPDLTYAQVPVYLFEEV